MAVFYLVIDCLGENAFFLKRANRASAKRHGDFLTVYHESLLLKVWLKHAIGATQREANIVAKLLSFTGEFASCCHNLFSLFPFFYSIGTLASILPFFTP